MTARFYVPPSAIIGKSFVLSDSEAHHAVHVLRKKVGDEIDLFDGKDKSFRGRIDSIAPREIRGTILADITPGVLPIQITLYQALTRGAKWEWLLEKVCEVGVHRVVPVYTQRTLIKLTVDQESDKLTRWNRIALAASKQSGRASLMTVEPPQPLAVAFTQLEKGSLSIIPWEKESNRSIHEACESFKGKVVNIFIGPEGGWDASEIELATAAEVIPVRLGPTLLRTETAGIVSATLILREFGLY